MTESRQDPVLRLAGSVSSCGSSPLWGDFGERRSRLERANLTAAALSGGTAVHRSDVVDMQAGDFNFPCDPLRSPAELLEGFSPGGIGIGTLHEIYHSLLTLPVTRQPSDHPALRDEVLIIEANKLN